MKRNVKQLTLSFIAMALEMLSSMPHMLEGCECEEYDTFPPTQVHIRSSACPFLVPHDCPLIQETEEDH